MFSVIPSSRMSTKKKYLNGEYRSPEYIVWASMKNRCLSESNPSYGHYGGRGIRVCERWLSFENFLSDMGRRPLGTSIDRIDNDGNYEPGNCRWATRLQQASNTSRITPITFGGITDSVLGWARRIGIAQKTLVRRIELGWTTAEALTTPVDNTLSKNHVRKYEHDGLCLTLSEWAKLTGITHGSIQTRLNAGWPLAKALTTPNRKHSARKPKQ